MAQGPTVFLNRFPVFTLDEQARTVQRYRYSLKQNSEGPDLYRAVNNILYKIGGVAGAKLGSEIVTAEAIADDYLRHEDWSLQHLGQRQLDPAHSSDRKILEQLSRKQLRQSLRHLNQYPVEKTGNGLILWDKSKIESEGEGWQVLKGALVDVVVNKEGQLSLEIDSHYRFHSPWTVHQWLETHPTVPLNYVRNVSDAYAWYFLETCEERPEDIFIPDLGQNLAEYHRERGVSEQTIQDSLVVRVRHVKKWKRQQEPVAHLSQLLRPSVSMEILSYVAEQGDRSATEVLNKVRQPIQKRLEKGRDIARVLLKNVYNIDKDRDELKPEQQTATVFASPRLIARNETAVKRPNDAIARGCLRVGETKFGFLHINTRDRDWPAPVRQKLLSAANASGTTLDLSDRWSERELPDREIARRQFWSEISEREIKTLLVVSQQVGRQQKMQLRREALQAGIALQFMRPMPKPEEYRAANITLGLLVKAGWQPIGVKIPSDPQAADLTIGFDAGTNKTLFYGTSAFAVLADGQNLGWEIPEAQIGERFSGQAIWNATVQIIQRFRKLNDRNPRRILLLRDGFVRDREFNATLTNLEKENIAADLLEIHA